MKKFRIFGQTDPVNVVSNNKVDKDVQSMLLPLNLMQHIMFCPKYRIKDNIITPNSLISNIVSMLATLLIICSFLHSTYMVVLTTESLKYTTFLVIFTIYNCILYCLGFVINFVVGILQSKNSVQFVLTFQKMHRFINNETSFSHIIIWNWITEIALIGFFVLIYLNFHIKLGPPVYVAYVAYFLIAFDFNIVYAIRVIHILENKVVLWNIRVCNLQETEDVKEKKYYARVFQAYVEILECYDHYKNGFQHFILYYMVAIFIHALKNNKIIIDIFKTGSVHNVIKIIWVIVMMTCWLIKDLICPTLLTHQCQKFYVAVQNVQDTCVCLLKSTVSEHEKKLCKNVLRLHRASFSKIRVCGLFYLDAALQLSLISLLTNYTVVLLQFAFL